MSIEANGIMRPLFACVVGCDNVGFTCAGLEISENRHLPYITKFIGIHGENLIFSRNIKIFTCPAA